MTEEQQDINQQQDSNPNNINSGKPDPESLSYEAARDELAGVVQDLERGSLSLEDSLALWERGEALAARCEQWLLGAKERLEQVKPTQGTE